MIELGKKYKDSITGFAGVCTERVESISEAPRAKLETILASRWFSEARLSEAESIMEIIASCGIKTDSDVAARKVVSNSEIRERRKAQ